MLDTDPGPAQCLSPLGVKPVSPLASVLGRGLRYHTCQKLSRVCQPAHEVLLTKGKVNGGDHQPSHHPRFHRSQAANNSHSTTSLVRLHRLPRLQREHSRAKKYCAAVGSAAVSGAATLSPVRVSLTGLAIKNPPKKTHPKIPKKTHLKKQFFFTFFMKIIQTFLFETDFL
jgi:hypothetical protein